MKKICVGLVLLVLLPCWALAKGFAIPDDSGGPRLGVVQDPGGDFQMALRYFAGEGVPRDNARGLAYLRRAAEAGHAEAQFNLGNYHNVFAADYAEAARWWRMAGRQDHPQALFNLAEMLAAGLVLPQPGESAAVYYRQAAALGFAAPAEGSAAPVPVETVTTPAAPATKPSPVAETVSAAAKPKSVWLDAPDDSATIQIFASSSLAETRAMAGRHPYKRPLALLGFERDGQTWHALLYGRFPDVAAARRAMVELPAVLRAGKPWPRRMGDVRAQTRMTIQPLPEKR